MRRNTFLNDEAAETPPKLTAVNSPAPARAAPLGARGAVGAMRDSLAQMGATPTGTTIVEVDTGGIDDSFVPDRMNGGKRQHDELVLAIKEQGQLVPVLLRPKPNEPGRYQVAYGHRRVRALRELGRPIKAVIRALSDEELIIAQGQENNARRDLSFIEKATFAMALEDRGFDREKTIVPALSVDKTELSRLISVGRSVPPSLIAAIGPAPKTGRRRWMELAGKVEVEEAADVARRLVATEGFLATEDSDQRFVRLLEALTGSTKPPAPRSRVWTDPRGRNLARIDVNGDRFTLSIDEKIEPAFGSFLESWLPEIFRAFVARGEASTAFPQSDKEG